MTLSSVFFAYYGDYFAKKENTNSVQIQNQLPEILVREIFYSLSFLIIFVPGALRSFVGIDYTTYSYQQIPMVLAGISIKIEPLYKLVIYAGNWLGGGISYQPVFVITNFLIVGILFLFVRQQSKNVPFSIYIFMTGGFFAFSLSGMRQSIGVVIALFCLKYIKKNKIIKYILGILVASLFHTSMLIFLPLYFIHRVKINPFFILIMMFLINHFAGLFRSLIMYASEKVGVYSNYFGGTFDNGQFSRLQVCLVLVIMIFLCLSRLVLGKTKFYSNNDELHLHYLACMIVSMISFLPTPSRLLFLFIPVYITLIPNTIFLYKDEKYKFFIKFMAFLIFAFFMYRNVYVQNAYEILPYKSIFGL